MYDDLSPAGQIIYFIARVFGARVTGGKRTAEENKAVGGIPNSKHLTGDAIDIAIDAPAIAISMLTIFGKVIRDEAGTAPHYHVEATSWTLPLFMGAFVAGTAIVVKK